MKGLFNPDNFIIRGINRFGSIWWINILWLVCSLPIVTIGASTTALVYSCIKLKNNEGYVTSNFFKSFKENLIEGTIIWIIYLLLGVLMGVALIFWNRQEGFGAILAWCIDVVLILFYAISLLYVFAILDVFKNGIVKTIKYSVLVAGDNIKATIVMSIFVMGVILINLTSVLAVNLITINVGVGLVAYVLSYYYNDIFVKYGVEGNR